LYRHISKVVGRFDLLDTLKYVHTIHAHPQYTRTYTNTCVHTYIQSDLGALEMDPLDDPKALKAAEALMIYINTIRQTRCRTKALYTGTPQLLYSKHGYVSGDKSQYRLEVLVGASFFTRLQL
jgi:hypothetical protein